ncbi:hypothetical protein PZA11_002932 [Diplocarpon coronariae]
MVFPALFLSCACGLQFWFYVPSLYQARTAGHIIDDTSLVGLRDVVAQPSVENSGIPHILYAASGFTSVTATAMILAGASATNLSLCSIYVVINTNFAACGGGIAWAALDYAFECQFSIFGLCSSIIAGLHFISIDDGLEIFAIHGVGSYVGDVLTGFFATSFVPALDGTSGSSYTDCWWNEHWRQVGYRLAAATMCAAWSFAISCPAVHYQQDPRMPGQS